MRTYRTASMGGTTRGQRLSDTNTDGKPIEMPKIDQKQRPSNDPADAALDA